jgi:hypothetical protein
MIRNYRVVKNAGVGVRNLTPTYGLEPSPQQLGSTPHSLRLLLELPAKNRHFHKPRHASEADNLTPSKTFCLRVLRNPIQPASSSLQPSWPH